jgi:hypothetical protein
MVGNTALPPHWVAFRKSGDEIVFGDIGYMGEIADLAPAVGTEWSRMRFSVK